MSDILKYEQQIKIQNKLDKQELQQLKSDIKETFDKPAGIRVLNRLMSICQIYNDTFTGNSRTFFLEGKRSVGLEVLEMIMETDVEIYIKMLRENNKDG